jgi:hypothetical protein
MTTEAGCDPTPRDMVVVVESNQVDAGGCQGLVSRVTGSRQSSTARDLGETE